MTSASTFFDRETIRDLAARSDVMGALLVAHAWAVIAGMIALFTLWPNPVTFLLAVIVIGSRQLGLAILMHDAAHNALFKSRRLNDVVGEWACGRPILAELASYRHYHLTHHRFTQTDKDPDLHLSAKFPTSRASLIRKFTRDLTGRTGMKVLLQQIVLSMRLAGDADAIDEAGKNTAEIFNTREIRKSLGAFVLVMVAFGLIGEWWYGFAFWMLPYVTWFQLVLRIRNIAEHGATEKSENPLRNTRTTKANLLERALVAPYWVNYHLEHHIIMHVPCWRLPELHRRMVEKAGNDMNIAPSYTAALREAGW